MKATQLDNFSEGFKVAPRKPHSAKTSAGIPLTYKERSMAVIDIVRSRLNKYGICHGSIFTDIDRRNALNHMRRMQVNGVIPLERITNKSGEIIAYKVIEA